MDAGRLKVKSPYRHTDCSPLTGVTGSAAHISGTLSFTFNCHTLHKPPQEVRRDKMSAVNCQMLYNFFTGKSTLLKGGLAEGLRGTEGRRGRGCTVKEEKGGVGTKP